MAISIHSFYSISFMMFIHSDQMRSKMLERQQNIIIWYGAMVSPIFLSTLYSTAFELVYLHIIHTHAHLCNDQLVEHSIPKTKQYITLFFALKTSCCFFPTRMCLYIPFHIHTEALNTIGDRWETFVSLGLFWFAFYFVCYYYFFPVILVSKSELHSPNFCCCCCCCSVWLCTSLIGKVYYFVYSWKLSGLYAHIRIRKKLFDSFTD